MSNHDYAVGFIAGMIVMFGMVMAAAFVIGAIARQTAEETLDCHGRAKTVWTCKEGP